MNQAPGRAYYMAKEQVDIFLRSLDEQLKKIPPWSRYIGVQFALIIGALETKLKQLKVPSRSGHRQKYQDATLADPEVLRETCEDMATSLEILLRHIDKNNEYSVVIARKERSKTSF